MLHRRWLVVRTVDNASYTLDRAWTKRGAMNKRHYWYVLQRAVGNRARLDVVHK